MTTTIAPISTAASLLDLLRLRAREVPHAVALRHKALGIWHAWTWGEVAVEVEALARSFIVAGVASGAHVAILGDHRPRLLLAMLALQAVGAIPAPIRAEFSTAQLHDLIDRYDIRLAVAAGRHEVERLEDAIAGQGRRMRIVYDQPRGLARRHDQDLLSLDALVAAGSSASPSGDSHVPTDIAFLLTATTIDGAVSTRSISHDALIGNAREIVARHGVTPHDRLLVNLSLAWEPILTVLVGGWLTVGFPLAFGETESTALHDLGEVSPTVIVGPPLLYRRLRQILFTRVAGAARWRRRLIDRALGITDSTAVAFSLARWLVGRPVKDLVGLGSARLVLSFGGPLPKALAESFARLGLPVEVLQEWADDATADDLVANALTGSLYIRHALPVRAVDGSLGALIVPDTDALSAWARLSRINVSGPEAFAGNPAVLSLLAADIRAAGGANGPRRFLLAGEPFTTAAGEISGEGRVLGGVVRRTRASIVERLAHGDGHDVTDAGPRTVSSPTRPLPVEPIDAGDARFVTT